LRDPRGFAMKYFTDEGNWDLVGNNAPIFFIRDPILFPSFIHSQKRNPRTNLHDPNMVWDFVSLRPEAINMILRIFSDLGTPDGFRKMNGFGTNTFKLVSFVGDFSRQDKIPSDKSLSTQNREPARFDRLQLFSS